LPGRLGPAAGPTQEVVLTTCPFCAAGCGILLQTRDGEVHGVAPAQRHPISGGRLCVRGWSAHEAPLWGRRLLFPTVKDRGERRRVSWDEALATAAREIRALIFSGKRVGVLGSGRVSNEEAFLAVRLARDALETSHLDVSLRPSFQALLNGLRPDGGPLAVPALKDVFRGADLLLLVEDDLALSHPQVAFSVLQALTGGARLVSLGLARTQMAALSDPWLPLDPLGSPGIPPRLEEALGAPGSAEKVVVVLAWCFSGADRLRGTVEDLTRRIERWVGAPGPEIQYLPLPFLANSRGAYEMGFAPGILPGVRLLYDQAARSRLRAEWGPAVRLEDGLGAEAMLRELDGLILIREDPHEWHPSPGLVSTNLEAMDCVILLDAYSSPVSDGATVTLPVGAFTEEEGTLVSLDGLVQRWAPARRLPGEARQGWHVLADLLRSLGIQAGYNSARDVTKEIGHVIPEFSPTGSEGHDRPWNRRIPELRIPPGQAASCVGARVVPNGEDTTHCGLE